MTSAAEESDDEDEHVEEMQRVKRQPKKKLYADFVSGNFPSSSMIWSAAIRFN